MAKSKDLHFRVETMALLNEIVDCMLPRNAGILYIPLNQFRTLLGQLAQRCTELHDPVLDRICFDLTLYELPKTQDERNKLMKQLYAAEKKYLKESKRAKSILKERYK